MIHALYDFDGFRATAMRLLEGALSDARFRSLWRSRQMLGLHNQSDSRASVSFSTAVAMEAFALKDLATDLLGAARKRGLDLSEPEEEVIVGSGCFSHPQRTTTRTPLHDAVLYGTADMVRDLLLHGADPLVRASSGGELPRGGKSIADLDIDGKNAVDLFAIRYEDAEREDVGSILHSWNLRNAVEIALKAAAPTQQGHLGAAR